MFGKALTYKLPGFAKVNPETGDNGCGWQGAVGELHCFAFGSLVECKRRSLSTRAQEKCEVKGF